MDNTSKESGSKYLHGLEIDGGINFFSVSPVALNDNDGPEKASMVMTEEKSRQIRAGVFIFLRCLYCELPVPWR